MWSCDLWRSLALALWRELPSRFTPGKVINFIIILMSCPVLASFVVTSSRFHGSVSLTCSQSMMKVIYLLYWLNDLIFPKVNASVIVWLACNLKS